MQKVGKSFLKPNNFKKKFFFFYKNGKKGKVKHSSNPYKKINRDVVSSGERIRSRQFFFQDESKKVNNPVSFKIK